MIHIITGDVDSGKTTALLSMYRELRGSAEGFAILKEYQAGQFIGQKVLDLLSGETTPFSYLEGHLPSDQPPDLKFGRFHLLEDGLLAADESIRKARLHGAKNIFVDEFGPIELQEKGLWPTYQRLVDRLDFREVSLYMAIRYTCVTQCIQRLRLTCYDINIKLMTRPNDVPRNTSGH